MDFTYIIYGENIYYLDQNNLIFSIEGYHGTVKEGFSKNQNFVKPKLLDDYFIEDATPEEIAESNKPIVPQTISAMRLKLQLFDLGITDQDIFDDIDSIPEAMFSTADKEKAKIKYKTATTFERTNGELNFVATMEGLTQEQVDQIFINGNL